MSKPGFNLIKVLLIEAERRGLWPIIIAAVFAAFAALFAFMDGIGAAMSIWHADPYRKFHAFLLVAVLLPTAGASLWPFMTSALVRSYAREEAGKSGLELLHEMVEVVRAQFYQRAPVGKQDRFSKLLGSDLPNYVRAIAGVSAAVHVTVKVAEGDVLRSVFRDSGQHRDGNSSCEELSGHYLFEKLQGATHRRSFVVRDTELLDSGNKSEQRLKTRAGEGKYRALLVIPIKDPGPEDGDMAAVIGFLAIDSPQVDAFRWLFGGKMAPVELDNTGRDWEDGGNMHVLFGLADALATIILAATPDQSSISDRPARRGDLEQQ